MTILVWKFEFKCNVLWTKKKKKKKQRRLWCSPIYISIGFISNSSFDLLLYIFFSYFHLILILFCCCKYRRQKKRKVTDDGRNDDQKKKKWKKSNKDGREKKILEKYCPIYMTISNISNNNRIWNRFCFMYTFTIQNVTDTDFIIFDHIKKTICWMLLMMIHPYITNQWQKFRLPTIVYWISSSFYISNWGQFINNVTIYLNLIGWKLFIFLKKKAGHISF